MDQQSNRPRRWRRLALASTFVGLGLIGGLAAATPASAATAKAAPASTAVTPAVDKSNCSSGSSGGNVTACIEVVDVTNGYDVEGILQVNDSARALQLCVNTPGVVACTPAQGFITIQPGGTLQLNLNNLPRLAGNYCTNVWRRNSDGSKTEIVHVCVTE